jgi:anion-transporting  ArsA/GET3 family ATPase
MNIKNPDLKRWVVENRETLIGQLVLYHSPVALAELLVDDQKLDDVSIGRIKKRLEVSEGLLKKETAKRKKDAKANAAASGVKVAKAPMTADEADDEEKKEKVKKTVTAQEKADADLLDDIFVDDDFVPDQGDDDGAFDSF